MVSLVFSAILCKRIETLTYQILEGKGKGVPQSRPSHPVVESKQMAIASVNPATGELLQTFQADTPAEVERKLALSAAAFRQWRRVSFPERARLMTRAAEILEQGKDRYGRIMTAGMGKPIQSARDEAVKCAWACRHYAENAERLLADPPVETAASLSFIRYQPLGPILAVMPWNFPFWQVFRFAVPALMAGNTGLLKHASNVPQCALAIAGVFREAGFPEGAFQTLLIGSDAVASVIADERVKAVTLTGSDPPESRWPPKPAGTSRR